MSDTPLFTLFTPTYNRAHTIQRVYDSLCAQTLRDFEWLVIDDGSTDGTAELIARWSKTADFPIRYFVQTNSGKHIAHNRAVREARGLLFAPLDSDDAMPPDSLAKIAAAWNSIPESERPDFSGIWGLCCDQYGAAIGDRYPTNPYDGSLRDLFYVHHMHGEKWGITRTEILRRFPFPAVEGSRFIPEGMVWLQVAKDCKARFVNEVIRIYYVDDDATGPTLSRRKHLGENAAGRMHYYVWLLNNDLGYFFHSPMPFLKAAVMLPIVAWLAGQSLPFVLKSLQALSAKTLVGLMLPAALLIFAFDKARLIAKRTAALVIP